jgi:flagellar basal body-associated protein FliL
MGVGFVLLVILVVLIVIIILAACSWTYAKPKLIKYATNKVIQNLPKHDDPTELNVNDTRTAAKLTYFHKGAEYTVYLPYDKKMQRKVGYTVFHELGNKKVNITQESGIPYMVTANMLGGGKITVYKDDELKHTYKDDDMVKL